MCQLYVKVDLIKNKYTEKIKSLLQSCYKFSLKVSSYIWNMFRNTLSNPDTE